MGHVVLDAEEEVLAGMLREDLFCCLWCYRLARDYLGKKIKRFARMAEQPENVTFHSLRSTCISWLVMNGVPLRIAQ